MSIVFATTVDIAASPEQVWDVLSDFPAYGEWSNFSRIDGTPELGSQLRMRMPGFWFTSTVTAATPDEELRWSAKLLTAGLFLGEHRFTLVRNADGSTQVNNSETFSGALTRPFEKFFAKNHDEGGYAVFNRALKSRVEARASLPETARAFR
ncbi:SRPBCC domain-containing protein [Herbiconiux sp. CPCC 205763]|uniref:SRPBCC domain-containing protein n=1 Tax=Herbiconiux aconitum TaxID=2970913 RepID=A0ABT2GNH5_9MICO|nr:SRPBCC domain-containing protein [Herbiconiux aconitum]MCS5717775.1 SRPBCC domain-containing protein [Herbiconiux aconitum]